VFGRAPQRERCPFAFEAGTWDLGCGLTVRI
jgi:hypothetical protein